MEHPDAGLIQGRVSFKNLWHALSAEINFDFLYHEDFIEFFQIFRTVLNSKLSSVDNADVYDSLHILT